MKMFNPLFGVTNFFIFYLLFSKEMLWCALFFIGGYYVGTNYGMNHPLSINQTGIALGDWKVVTAENGKFTVAGWDIYIKENKEARPPPSFFDNFRNITWYGGGSDKSKKEE